MAFVSNYSPDEEEQKNPSQGAVPPSGGGGGVQLAPSGGVGNVGASSTPGQPAGGGQFATLDKYISANQGQAEPLANKITAGVGKEYSTLEGQNAATLNDISGQVAANATPGNYNETLAKEAANPVSFAGDQGNVKQFQSLLNASYGGPASAESVPGFSAQQNAINKAIASGKQATTTEAGRNQLLRQNEAAPSTSVTGFNSAILSQSPEALSKVEEAYKPFSNLLTGLSTGAGGINQNIAQAKSTATAANTAANRQIADQVSGLNTGVNTELSNAMAARDAYNNAVESNRQTWNPVNTQVNSLNEILAKITKGFTPLEGQAATVENPLGQYVNAPLSVEAPTMEAVATPEQYAKAQAFQNLLAGLNTGIPAPILNAANASQAGTYKAPTAPTIADPKAQAKAISDAVQRTFGSVLPTGPNGALRSVGTPWFNTGDYYMNQANMQAVNPTAQALSRLLEQIYGGRDIYK